MVQCFNAEEKLLNEPSDTKINTAVQSQVTTLPSRHLLSPETSTRKQGTLTADAWIYIIGNFLCRALNAHQTPFKIQGLLFLLVPPWYHINLCMCVYTLWTVGYFFFELLIFKCYSLSMFNIHIHTPICVYPSMRQRATPSSIQRLIGMESIHFVPQDLRFPATTDRWTAGDIYTLYIMILVPLWLRTLSVSPANIPILTVTLVGKIINFKFYIIPKLWYQHFNSTLNDMLNRGYSNNSIRLPAYTQTDLWETKWHHAAAHKTLIVPQKYTTNLIDIHVLKRFKQKIFKGYDIVFRTGT